MKQKLIETYQKESTATFTDALTGLYNHGVFQLMLENEIKRSNRYGELFAMAFIDIDNFSLYNKTHNAAVGDRVLKQVGRQIRGNLREADIAARYAGDLFVVLLPRADLHTAGAVMERIRKSAGTCIGDITLSIGLASYTPFAGGKEAVIGRAREALNRAKCHGKDQVWFPDDTTSGPSSAESRFRILIVDDDPYNVKLMKAILSKFSYEIFEAFDGESALSLMQRMEMDLVLLDAMMPGMDGFEVCRRLKGSDATRLIPVIMVTALDSSEDRVRGIEAGVDDFVSKPPNRIELVARINSLLKVNALNRKLTSIENAIFSMANAVEAKDAYTQGHIQRVAHLAMEVGKRMNRTPAEIESLWFAGILHDIGKISVPREVLNKPEPLGPGEWEIVRQHPVVGEKICRPLKKALGPALEAIRHHHEKLDGTGYPDGIKGEAVSILSRILAVVDIFDALDTDRPYRKRLPREKTWEILKQEVADGKLDAEVVSHLIAMAAAKFHEETSASGAGQ